MPFSRRRAVAEIAAVISTCALYLVFENVLHLKLQFLAVCILGWCAYLVPRLWRDAAARRAWGFRLDTLAPSAAACAGLLAVTAGAILAWRAGKGWTLVPGSTALLFLAYPVWALMQQFFVQSLVAGNLDRLGAPRAATVPIAALLFGLAHAPDLPLMALCAGAGVAWTAIFLRWPNLIPISLTHAWLGSLTFVMVLERNPWNEMNVPG